MFDLLSYPLFPPLAGAALVLLLAILIALQLRRRRRERQREAPNLDLAPALHLRTSTDDVHVVPQVIYFPTAGKLRLGYYPPYMDRHVGRGDFSELPHVDVRGDAHSVRELSRHVACIWREGNGQCYVQLGWPGPGEPIRPRNQSRVLRSGRPHDAASQPFRLAHRDVLRLSSNVEYVFLEVDGLRDRSTPEQKKIDAFESSSIAPSSNAKLSLLRPPRRTLSTPPSPDPDDDDNLA